MMEREGEEEGKARGEGRGFCVVALGGGRQAGKGERVSKAKQSKAKQHQTRPGQVRSCADQTSLPSFLSPGHVSRPAAPATDQPQLWTLLNLHQERQF